VNKSYLDFNDMIIRTLSLFKNQSEIKQKFQNNYKYILVDEFQDVNNLQVELINQLLTKDSQLFCVGDDWQSIYGFRGSEVNYIINFDKYFEGAKVIKLRLNYRSTENIVGASNEVIKHNKFKIDKDIVASKKSKSKINIYAANNVEEGVEYFITEAKRLFSNGYSNEDILVLYRRNKMFSPYYERIRKEKLNIKGRTIHASKGLEAKVVFIIGLTEGNGGFPDIWLEDRIFQVVRNVKHDLLLEEERRLFYVALTRAKDELYLITEKGNESSFLDEIPEEYSVSYKKSIRPIVDIVYLCENCNNQIDKFFKYCPHCGIKTNAQDGNNT
jgi:DNA helicase-4